MNKQRTIAEIRALLLESLRVDNSEVESLRLDERKGVQQLLLQFDKKKLAIENEKKSHFEKLTFERECRKNGFQLIAGIDEVGRGPLAGPVVTAAVILPEKCDRLIGVNDSKQLSHEKRQQYVELIKEEAICYAITVTPVSIIDQKNIYEATKISMMESILKLSPKPDYLLLDAMKLSINLPQESLIKGDQRSLSIAAASILAKEFRDQLMIEYAQLYPEFGFEHHMGYGTKEHLDALSTYGYTPIHRQSFAPVYQTKKQYQRHH